MQKWCFLAEKVYLFLPYPNEFDKNANSIMTGKVKTTLHKISLAIIGVCVFCASTSVDALFYFVINLQTANSKSNFQR